MFRLHNVVVAVMRKLTLRSVARLAGASHADAVGNHDEVFGCVQRLAFAEQLAAESWQQPVLSGTAGAVQQHNPVGDRAQRIPPRRTKSDVMQP